MRITYNRNFTLIELTEEEIVDIYTEYPADDAFCAPYIRDEERITDDDLNQGGFYDSLIGSILTSLNVENYIGTNCHGGNFYSDYYDFEETFINILFEVKNNLFYVEAIFLFEKK